MNTIVVGYDEADGSDRALDRAADLAKAFGARLIVTSVAPILVSVGGAQVRSIPSTRPSASRELADAREPLDSLAWRPSTSQLSASAADTILELAAERDADMIVVGTREPGIVTGS